MMQTKQDVKHLPILVVRTALKIGAYCGSFESARCIAESLLRK